MVIISQCILIPKYHAIHIKYTQFSFVNFISINLGKRERNEEQPYWKGRIKLSLLKDDMNVHAENPFESKIKLLKLKTSLSCLKDTQIHYIQFFVEVQGKDNSVEKG